MAIEITTHHLFDDVTAEQVWEVLTNFESFTEWNPFIIKASLINDKNLVITTHVIDDKPQTFHPTIVEYIPNTKLRWIGKIGSEYILKAEHSFTLKCLDNGKTQLTHSEKFSGLLSCLINQDKQNKIKKSFENMNQALNTRIRQIYCSGVSFKP